MTLRLRPTHTHASAADAARTIAMGAARTAALAMTICAGLATSAQSASLQAAPPPAETSASIASFPETFATITPSLSPDRLNAKGSLTFTIHYAGGEFGVPSPVRRSVLQFPAGLSLDIPELRSCSAARLGSAARVDARRSPSSAAGTRSSRCTPGL